MNVDPSLRWVLAATIVLYIAVMYALALVARRKIASTEDYLVAGRRLPLSLAWMTLLATWFGAGTLLTAADEVRREGLRAAALDPFGAGVCLLLAGLFVAAPMWRMGLLTVPDLFYRRFGRAGELMAALIMVPSYFGWIAAQFVALAHMLDLFFDIDLRWGILLVAVIGTGYTYLGGMWSVTMTDAVQITLVLLGLLVLAATVLMQLGGGHLVGGWLRLLEQTPAEQLRPIPMEDVAQLLLWLGVFAAGALGNLPGQDLMQRIFSARSAHVARNACLVAGIAYLSFGSLPLLIGLGCNLLLEDVDTAIIPAMAQAFLHPVVMVIFTVALMSAVLSTIDSAILSPAGVLAQNVLQHVSRRPLLWLNRRAVLVVAACSCGMAYLGQDAYELLEGAYELTLVGLFVPFIFAVYTKPRRGGLAAILSMSLGTAVWLVHYLAGWDVFLQPIPAFASWRLSVALIATQLSLLAYLAVEPPWRLQRAPKE